LFKDGKQLDPDDKISSLKILPNTTLICLRGSEKKTAPK